MTESSKESVGGTIEPRDEDILCGKRSVGKEAVSLQSAYHLCSRFKMGACDMNLWQILFGLLAEFMHSIEL